MARRKRRSGGWLDLLNGFLSLIVLVAVVVAGVAVWGISQFYSDGPVAEATTFDVVENDNLGSVAARLENGGLISAPLLGGRMIMTIVGGRLLDRGGDLKPGRFNIAAGASMSEILTELTEGSPIPYFVTIPEGWTSWTVAQTLNDDRFELVGEISTVPAEGSVLPGRYDFLPGATRTSVLEQMQAAMTKATADAWAACDPTVCGPDQVLKSAEDLITLASIVEKETGLATERPIVAGLFINRLKQGMRLETDPTIIYGITMGRDTLDGGITASQKAKETPYNTYIISGLPPTPIANPGIETIRAVANPDDTDAIYMMARTPNKPADGHYFAATLAEHQANVARYRDLEDALPPDPVEGSTQ